MPLYLKHYIYFSNVYFSVVLHFWGTFFLRQIFSLVFTQLLPTFAFFLKNTWQNMFFEPKHQSCYVDKFHQNTYRVNLNIFSTFTQIIFWLNHPILWSFSGKTVLGKSCRYAYSKIKRLRGFWWYLKITHIIYSCIFNFCYSCLSVEKCML